MERVLFLSGLQVYPTISGGTLRSLALAGHKTEARDVLAEAAETAPHLSAYQQATVQVALGRTARALDLLERAGEERDPWLVWLKVDPMLESLRTDPRLRRLLGRVMRRAGAAVRD